jgi:quercetin dioxygenase-like cupin family protein
MTFRDVSGLWFPSAATHAPTTFMKARMLKSSSILPLLLLCATTGAHCADQSAPVVATPVLTTSETWNGKPITFPSGAAEVTALSIDIQPGAETGWHRHPVPSFAVVLQGRLQVTLRDGRTREFAAGEAFAEVVDTVHNGRNIGDVPTKPLVLYTGARGASLTVKE